MVGGETSASEAAEHLPNNASGEEFSSMNLCMPDRYLRKRIKTEERDPRSPQSVDSVLQEASSIPRTVAKRGAVRSSDEARVILE